MENPEGERAKWQAEADLLADARDHLEKLTRSIRYRDLYPQGPSLALLLAAYQDLWRLRRIGRLEGASRRRLLRALKRLVRFRFRQDTVDRSRRVAYAIPAARPSARVAEFPATVRRALAAVDVDAREPLEAYIRGDLAEVTPSASTTGVGPSPALLARGLEQLRRALVNEALADPAAIPSLPASLLRFTASPQPARRRHPILALVFVKIPLYFWMTLLLIFNVAYLGAWWFFNDETFARFLGPTISEFVDGDLEFESIHWQPRLIIDLITGTPTPAKVRGFRVYEGYKYLGQKRRRLAVYAEEVEAELVLHEIIPWNRLGVPPVFEVPWYLHFTRAGSDKPIKVWAREYAVERRDGETEWRLSLPAAFGPPNDEPAPPDTRGISIKVDEARFTDLTLDVDMRSRSRWQNVLHMSDARVAVRFDGEHPKEPPRERLHLAFDIAATIDEGQLDILALGDDGYRIPIRDMKIESLRSGDGEIPYGDLTLRADARFAGSPVAISAILTDFLGDDPISDLTMLFGDAAGIAGLAITAHGLPASMVEAEGVPMQLTVRGPLSDPTIGIAAQGMTIHPDEDYPEWVLDDADLAVALRSDPLPPPWESRFPEGTKRWHADFERFSATFLDGPFEVDEHGIPTRVILPEGDDTAFLVTGDFDLRGVDPGVVYADDPATAKLLQGELRGDLAVPALIADFGGESMEITRAELGLGGIELRRDHGPAQDGLPRTIRADGRITYDSAEGLDLDGLVIGVDGGKLELDGGTDETLRLLRPTRVALRVDDGAAFLAGFDLDPYFDRLEAGLTLAGPLGGPDGSDGALSIGGVGKGDVMVTGIDDARLWMERGVLHVRSPDIALLGGRGRVSADVDLFERGEPTSDPDLRASVDLSGAELGRLTGDAIRGRADVQVEVGDAAGNPVPLSRFQARGALFVDRLNVGSAEIRRAEARFDLDTERLTIANLRLPYDRRLSPFHAPEVTVPAGELNGSGTITFADDPELDLRIGAWGLPLSLFARAIDYPDFPFGGQIGAGSRLEVRGSLSRPIVEGTVALGSLSAAGVPLGQGDLAFRTADRPAEGGLAARREVHLEGAFAAPRQGKAAADRLDWRMVGTVAFGRRPRRGSPALAASVTADFAHLPVKNLLPRNSPELAESVEGQMEGLRVVGELCDPREDLLASCRDDPPGSDFGLRVQLALDRLWLRDRGRPGDDTPRPKDPCDDPTSLCSTNPLVAALDGSSVRLAQPWTVRSGGPEARQLSVAGAFDLSEAPPEEPGDPGRCAELARTAVDRATAAGGGRAELRGDLALAALTAFVRPYGVRELKGRLGVDLDVRGHISAPVIRGIVDVPTQESPVSIRLAGQTPWVLAIPELAVRIAGDHIFAAGALSVRDQRLEFGDFTRDGRESTYYALSGPCAGDFQVAAQGAIDGKLVAEYLPDVATKSSGSLVVDRLLLAGKTGEATEIGAFHLDVAPGPSGFRATLALPEIEPVEITRGNVEVARCSAVDPCPDGQDGYAVYLGGRVGARANAAPSSALRARIGDRGRATAWGTLVVSPELDRLAESSIHVALDEVNYRQFDNSGRPELTATFSSEDINLEGRDGLVLRGEILVERSRWIRDAQEGVKVLSFADPSTAPESPPPALLQDLLLDLRVRTAAPFRVDNNVMKGVEGQVALAIGGTLSDLDLAGRIDVGTGVLDLAILGSAFDIQYGKVLLEKELDESTVDLLALRQEPIYIDGQPRQMAVRLTGTLDAINLRCIVQGDTRTRQRTTRECVDYLVLGAGNRDVSSSTTTGVRRTGGGGLLGKPIGLVGNLTELKLDRYIEESAPRMAPYVPDLGMRLGQYGIEVEAETPRPWFRSEWGNLSLGAGYTRGYPGLLLRNSYNWRVRFQILDNASLELRDSKRSYFNERIIFDPLRQRSLELRFDAQVQTPR